MTDLAYPDGGGLLDDRSVLDNAVDFGTEQRAFMASQIYGAPLEKLDAKKRAFFALEAFKDQMTATEDSLTWLRALRSWRPGKAQTSLSFKLKEVHFGGGPQEEAKRLAFLDSLDVDGLRKLLHLSTPDEHLRAGVSEEAVTAIESALPAQVGGFQRIAALRREENGTRVAAFGTLKHAGTAIFLPELPGEELFVPAKLDYKDDSVRLARLSLSVHPDAIRNLASSALTMQATLHSILAAVRWVRFGVPYVTPRWAAATLDLPTWRAEP